MNILGHGVDVVDVSRIATLLAKGEDFILGWFTTRELGQLGERAAQANVIAGRVAAKEASVKALGCGFDDEVSWQDVEIVTSDAGAPSVHLSGGAAAVAARLGVVTVLSASAMRRTWRSPVRLPSAALQTRVSDRGLIEI
jgi:holo-[acyl-carrier protein] synthase